MSFNGRVHHRYVFVNSMCIHMDISIREYRVDMSRVRNAFLFSPSFSGKLLLNMDGYP